MLTGVTAKTNISRRGQIGREPQVHYANYRTEPTNINLILVGVKSVIAITRPIDIRVTNINRPWQ